MKTIISVFLLLFSINALHAQFGRLLDKVLDEVIDNVAEKAAIEISNKLVRNINKKFDESLKESYDSTQQAKYPTYEDYVSSLNNTTDLPSKFEFDVWVDVETKEKKKNSEMRMYFSKESPIIGMETTDKGNTSLIVMDIDKDITVVYITDEEGEKSAQTMPSFQRLSKYVVKYAVEKSEDDEDSYFEKTGKTKNIAGYSCDEYKGGSKDGTYTMYLAKSFPVSWEQTYFGHWMQYLSDKKKDEYPMGDGTGMMMLMDSKDKKGRKSSWEVILVKEDKTIIDNADYSFR